MKTRVMVAASVAQSDAFLSLSIEAQWLYLQLLFEADVVGRILGIRRITRGYGVDESCLDELAAGGFLMQVNGVWFDRHTWRNNKFAAKIATRAQDDEAIASGALQFEGEPFKSSYLVTPSCDTATTKRNQDTSRCDVIQRNGNAHAPAPADSPAPPTAPSLSPEPAQSPSRGECDQTTAHEGKEMRDCLCPRCKTPATFWQDQEGTHIKCPTCGQYEYKNNH